MQIKRLLSKYTVLETSNDFPLLPAHQKFKRGLTQMVRNTMETMEDELLNLILKH